MNQNFRMSMENMAETMMEIANLTRMMSWLEKNFEEVRRNGCQCRALLAVVLKREECDKENIAKILKIKPHTAYIYLQQLEKKGLLKSKPGKNGQRVYFPKFDNGFKINGGVKL